MMLPRPDTDELPGITPDSDLSLLFETEFEDSLTIARVASERFCIDSEERANWLLRKLANIAAERDRVQRQAAAILEELAKDEKKLHDRFDAELQIWASAEMKRRKTKTVKLLQGNVSLRTVPASLRVADPEAALAYAREHHTDLVQIVEKLDGKGFHDLATEEFGATGELLPGVERTQGHESMKINVVAATTDFNALAAGSTVAGTEED